LKIKFNKYKIHVHREYQKIIEGLKVSVKINNDKYRTSYYFAFDTIKISNFYTN